MSGRLFLLVIMLCPAMLCLARPSESKNSLLIAHKNRKLTLGETHAIAVTVRRAGEDDHREPWRRSIRKTYSKRRINKRWKRYSHLKAVRARSAVKFEVPVNGNLISGVSKTGNIEKGKGHLPWPVSSGTVSMRFGLYEVLKGINHNSIGITIETAPGMPVTAAFVGYVYSIFNVDNKPVVMIRHGKYFTTYSNLAFVSVCKDEPVSTGQILGQVAENGQLDFIISDKMDNYYDPEKWLKK
jgi:septal ring factor EnvC (AmiA/AmiB activator)